MAQHFRPILGLSRALLVSALLTVLLYLTLYLLVQSQIDLVIFVPQPGFKEGKAELSHWGLFVWAFVVLGYAFFLDLLFRVVTHRDQTNVQRAVSCVILFVTSSVVILFVHPTLIAVTFPDPIRDFYFRLVVEQIEPLREIYFHWGLLHYLPWIIIIHMLVSAIVLWFSAGNSLNENDTHGFSPATQ